MSTIKTAVSKILNFNNEPSKRTEGQFWYDTNNNVLKRSDGTTYTPIPVGDNLISKGSTDTVKSVLNNKAEKTELSNYLKKSGDNSLELGNYENGIQGTILLNSMWDEYGYTKITGNNGIEIGSDVGRIWLDAGGTGIIFGSSLDYNDAEFIVNFNGISGYYVDTNLATKLEDGHIASSKAIKSYVDISILNKADKSDLSNYLPTSGGTISSNAHSALTIDVTGQNGQNVNGGLTVNSSYADWSTPDGDKRTDTTHYGASSITGDAVTTSIISGSEKLITSGGVYTALQSKADKSELDNKENKLLYYHEHSLNAGVAQIDTEYIELKGTNGTSIVVDGYGAQELVFNSYVGVSGTAIVSDIGSEEYSSKLPTEGAVVKSLKTKADNIDVVHLSGDEVITGNKLFTSSIRFSQDSTSLTPYEPGTPPTLIIDSNSNITIDASNVLDTAYYHSYGIISGSNSAGETFRIDGKYGTAFFSDLYVDGISTDSISGSAVVSTLGTSTTSSKIPTEGAVVKAISDVKTSLGSALTYEGSVENYANLPTGLTTSDKGKVYNVVNANGDIPAGTNYAWNGTSWDALGGDMSAYLRKEGDSLLSLGLFADPQNTGELRISSFNPDSGSNPSDTLLTGDTLTFSVADGPTTIYSAYGFEINRWGRGDAYFKIYPDSGITGSLVDTSIPSTPVAGHTVTTGAVKTYVDNSTSNKVEKNSDANLTSIVMPTFSSSTGAQNGSAKLKLYKDDTTGAITIEIEEVE